MRTKTIWRPAVFALCSGSSLGCGPRLIQDYAVRQNELFFAVQEGMSYSVGECQRAQNGQLSDCKQYHVDFR